MAYIDRDDLVRNLDKFAPEHYNALINMLIMKQPAADVVEAKHGEWIATEAYPHWFCCSVCHRKFVPNDEWIDRYNIPINYCPNCGAKMDGGEKRNGEIHKTKGETYENPTI